MKYYHIINKAREQEIFLKSPTNEPIIKGRLIKREESIERYGAFPFRLIKAIKKPRLINNNIIIFSNDKVKEITEEEYNHAKIMHLIL